MSIFLGIGLGVTFTCFQCSKTGNVGPHVEVFLALHPDFETFSPPLAERFALFWRDIRSRNQFQQLQFRTGNELQSPLTSYHAPHDVITDEELEWLQTSYRCLALSVRALVARQDEPHSAEEIADLQEEYDKYVRAMEFLHIMLEIMLVRRETWRQSSFHLEELLGLSTPDRPRSNPVDLTQFLAELSPEEIQELTQKGPFKCPICTNTVGLPSLSDAGEIVPAEEYVRVLCPFGHVFGRACIEQWFRQKPIPDCPLCRHAFMSQSPGLPGNGEGFPDDTEGEVESASDNEDGDERTTPWWWIAILRGDAPLMYS